MGARMLPGEGSVRSARMVLRALAPCGGAVVREVFRWVARGRRGPALHPRGRAFAGELAAVDPLPEGRYDVVVRLTKGAGLPGGQPDVLGLAVRVTPDSGEPWDLLLSSAGTGRLTRCIPTPARDWGSARYSTLSPYERRGRLFWLRATPSGKVGHASVSRLDQHAPGSFALSVAGRTGGWLTVGRLTLGGPIGDDGERFDPVLQCPPGWTLRPAWLRRVRELAYDGSRRGRR